MTADTSDNANLSEAQLDMLFRQMAAEAPEPGPDLMARIVADARSEAVAPRLPVAAGSAPATPGWFGTLIAQIGGIPGAAGLVAAGVGGILIGTADPSTFDLAASYLGFEVVAYDVDDLFATFPTLSEDG